MIWCSPDPRAIIELDSLHVSRRLRRTIGRGKFRVSRDERFADVIHGCASGPRRAGQTWLTPSMQVAYIEMHRLGYAHSVEVWCQNQLAGGVYGLAIGGMFAAESMFYRIRDASKVALVHLVQHLKSQGFALLDVQQWTEHTGRMGAIKIPRRLYLERLESAVSLQVTF